MNWPEIGRFLPIPCPWHSGQPLSLVEAGLGAWYGAFIGDELTSNRGIFRERGIARYQQVSTQPDHRRQGTCGTLVSAPHSSCSKTPHRNLRHASRPDDHAARIYESVDFRKTETNHALYWHSGMV